MGQSEGGLGTPKLAAEVRAVLQKGVSFTLSSAKSLRKGLVICL